MCLFVVFFSGSLFISTCSPMCIDVLQLVLITMHYMSLVVVLLMFVVCGGGGLYSECYTWVCVVSINWYVFWFGACCACFWLCVLLGSLHILVCV